MLRLILLGAPGAGKGTQADIISEKYGIPQISTGVILREEIAKGSELGNRVKGIIDAGNLVPDEDVVAIVKERLKQDDCKNGYILDGFPRTIPQAEALDKMLSELDSKIDVVISIEVADEDIVRRSKLSCGLQSFSRRRKLRKMRRNPFDPCRRRPESRCRQTQSLS